MLKEASEQTVMWKQPLVHTLLRTTALALEGDFWPPIIPSIFECGHLFCGGQYTVTEHLQNDSDMCQEDTVDEAQISSAHL